MNNPDAKSDSDSPFCFFGQSGRRFNPCFEVRPRIRAEFIARNYPKAERGGTTRLSWRRRGVFWSSGSIQLKQLRVHPSGFNAFELLSFLNHYGRGSINQSRRQVLRYYGKKSLSG